MRRHVHGGPGHSGRRHIVADDTGRAAHTHRPDELDTDGLSDRGSDRHSAYGLSYARAFNALVVCDRRQCFHSGVDRLRK